MAPKRYLITLCGGTHLTLSGVPVAVARKLQDGLRAAYLPPLPKVATATATFDELEAKILDIAGPAFDVRCTSNEDSFAFDDVDIQIGGT